MCKKGQLRSELTCANGLLMMASLAVFAVAIVMIVDNEGHVAYGEQVKNWGGVLVFCSFVMVVALVFGMFGTKRHNKFALTVALCTLLLGVSVTLIISVTLFVAVTPTYSKGFANECMQRPSVDGPPISTRCMGYFTDLGNIRLFRLWLTLYTGSTTDKAKRAMLLHFEDDNFCCGWGPPLQCMNTLGGNFSDYAPELLLSDRPVLEALNRCSRHLGWYQRNTDMCRIVDDNGFAGCPYMFSNSKTCEQLTTLRPGCAGFFQEAYMSKFRTYGLVAVGAAFIQIMTMVMSCCYCFKRKYTDVLPPMKTFSASEYEKYRFGVLGQDEPIVVEVAAGKDGAGKGKDSAPPAEGAGAPASGVVGDKGKPAGAGVGM